MDEFNIKHRMVIDEPWQNLAKTVGIDEFTVIEPRDGFVKFMGAADVGTGCFIDGSGGVVIEDGVTIGAGVKILSSENVPSEGGAEDAKVSHSRITIEKGCLIEPGAIILPGVILGAHSLVGPGAIVAGTLYPPASMILPPVGTTLEYDEPEPEVAIEEGSDEPEVPPLLGQG